MRFNLILAMAAATMVVASPAAAANLVTNGGFEQNTAPQNVEFGASFHYPNVVTGWQSPSTSAFNLYFFAGTETTVDALSRYPGETQRLSTFGGASPNGGNFVALDGDTSANGPLTQMIHGLTVGKTYNLEFSWAAAQLLNRFGQTTEQLFVTFGGDTLATAVVTNPTHGFQGWFTEKFSFTAHSSDQLLSFLSVGSPQGLPPMALLDGVSLQAAVPEPASWAMLLAGFGLVGAVARRQRRVTVAA